MVIAYSRSEIMNAIAKTKEGPGNIEYMAVKVPQISSHDVLLRVKAAAICGSDLGIYDWAEHFHGMQLPRVIGHEYAGEVLQAGQATTGFKVGDRVTGLATLGCGACLACRMGRTNICLNRRTYGYHMDGAFAEYMKVEARHLCRLPDDLSYIEAAPMEAAATAYHAVLEQTTIPPDSTVAIFGPGPIGLFALQFLNLLNVSRTFMIGTPLDVKRLIMAKDIGAELVIDVSQEDPVSRITEITSGHGVDFVFETSGNPAALEQALRMVTRGGQVFVVGFVSGRPQINWVDVSRKAVYIRGVYANTYETFDRLLRVIGLGKISLRQVITHVFPPEKAVEAFESAKSRQTGKVVFRFD